MDIWLIPGLGFDERVFGNIHIPGVEIKYINWIDPLEKESIADYTTRLLTQILDTRDELVLIGHSFGGIICQEISYQRKVGKIILISSIRSPKENPTHFKIVGPLHLKGLFTKSLIEKTFGLWSRDHGYDTEELRTLFLSMVNKHSDEYLKWALRELSVWKGGNPAGDTQIIQIHGTNDKTFPIGLLESPDHVIEGGDHLVVYKEAELINDILQQELK